MQLLRKIEADPEDEEIKGVERRLWDKIKVKATQGRRTGVGITAEGDMLAALGLRYGSDNAIDFSIEIHKTIALEAYRSSTIMAAERGPFTIFDAQREKNNPFIQRLKNEDEDLYNQMMTHGRRNISLLTIAPTGTTSLMTQTTSGIEPVFLPVYKRRRKVNPNDKHANITFTDEVGDSWEEYTVFHHKFVTWLGVNGYDIEEVLNYDDAQIKNLVEKSPYFKATSNDVDWMAKVKMQGQIQKWVDHSISVTINLPSDVKEELVGELYVKAWQSGCKGVTVYRDGSRTGVLVTSDEKKRRKQVPIEDGPRPARPRILDAEILRFMHNNEKWIAFIGLLGNRPYEIFTGRQDDEMFPIPKSITRGTIIKNKDDEGTRYDFQYTDKYGYKNTLGGLSHQFNKEYWNYAKLISGVLRYGMPIEDVLDLVNSLRLDSDTINTWTAGVSRALKRYVPNGTKAKGHETCSECGSDDLVYEEGCLKCNSCGNSKCG